MAVGGRDVRRTLRYYSWKRKRFHLWIGLFVALVGLAGLFSGRNAPIGGVIFFVGLGWSAFGLHHLLHPGLPALVLSPDGILFRFLPKQEFLIRWKDVRDIVRMDVVIKFTTDGFKRTLTLPDVTTVVVSEAFFEEKVPSGDAHAISWDRRNYFIPAGPNIRIALFHDELSVDARKLQEAVVTRWHAFRDVSSPAAPRDDRSAPPDTSAEPPADKPKIAIVGGRAVIRQLPRRERPGLPGQAD